jgi:hypothetical protein
MNPSAQMPTHHPAWPRRCPKCRKPADGFNVVVPVGEKVDPKTGELRQTAWGLNGVACIKCQVIHLPLVLSEAPSFVDQNYIGTLIYSAPWFRSIQAVVWLKEKMFNKKCCLPPEPESEPKGGA